MLALVGPIFSVGTLCHMSVAIYKVSLNPFFDFKVWLVFETLGKISGYIANEKINMIKGLRREWVILLIENLPSSIYLVSLHNALYPLAPTALLPTAIITAFALWCLKIISIDFLSDLLPKPLRVVIGPCDTNYLESRSEDPSLFRIDLLDRTFFSDRIPYVKVKPDDFPSPLRIMDMGTLMKWTVFVKRSFARMNYAIEGFTRKQSPAGE